MDSLDTLLARFRSLPPVSIHEIYGRWHGDCWYTGSIFCTLLRHTDWYGKEFRGTEDVDALLFRNSALSAGRPLALINTLMMKPFNLRPGSAALRTHTAGARVTTTAVSRRKQHALLRHPLGAARLEPRTLYGTESAAMCYRYVPIVDHFRRMGDGRLMGYMQIAGSNRPELFFRLARDHRPA